VAAPLRKLIRPCSSIDGHARTYVRDLCGVAPIPASSGKTTRYRLKRGNRQANWALYMLTVGRMGWHPPTRPPARTLLAGARKALASQTSFVA